MRKAEFKFNVLKDNWRPPITVFLRGISGAFGLKIKRGGKWQPGFARNRDRQRNRRGGFTAPEHSR
jgi:hypothetical protein